MQVELEEEEEKEVKDVRADKVGDVGEDERTVTPENTNSSRLLLSQFSSVKNLHRKDKHRRMLSGSLQRKKFFGHESEGGWNSDSETHNSSVSSSIDDVLSCSPSQNSADCVKAPITTNLDGLSSLDSGRNMPRDFFENRQIDRNVCEAGIDALPKTELPKSSSN